MQILRASSDDDGLPSSSISSTIDLDPDLIQAAYASWLVVLSALWVWAVRPEILVVGVGSRGALTSVVPTLF